MFQEPKFFIKPNFNDFGVELNLQNIDEHLKQQEINRHKFIDVKKYQIEVFGKIKFIKEVKKYESK